MNSNISEWIKQLDPNLISVVLPTYNRPFYLQTALIKLSTQTYKNIELIVVDDGSTSTEANSNKTLFDMYKNNFVKSVYIKLPVNSGTVSLPRNIGISHISGAMIAPTDDDCWPNPEKFSLLNDAIKNNTNAVLAFGNRQAFDLKTGKFTGTSNSAEFAINKTSVGIDNGQFIYKAQVYEAISPVLSINACDWHLYSSFADLGDFVFVDSVVCVYVWHGQNISLTPKHTRVDPISKLDSYKKFFNNNAFTEKVFHASTKCPSST